PLLEVPFVQLPQQIELLPLLVRREEIVFDVLDEFLDIGMPRIDVAALVDPREEGGLPVLRFLDWVAAGTHGDEAGQILVFGTQPVGDPRTETWPDEACF